MKNILKSPKKKFVIEELAKLLRVNRNEVKVLFAKAKHPLPEPCSTSPYDPWVFNGRYLIQLDAWVQEETGQRTIEGSRKFDARSVQMEISRAKNEFAEYDFSDRFPPGYFLG